MKILIDTNILISAVSKPDGRPNKVLRFVSESDNYEVYLTDQNLNEFRSVIKKKMPSYIQYIDPFLGKLDYEIVVAVSLKHDEASIRDTSDQPILNAAILNNIDIILTGDQDFLSMNLDHPRCLNPTQFCELENI